MQNLHDYSICYNGARRAIIDFWSMFRLSIKGEKRIYIQAVVYLITSNIRNTEKFMSGAEIRYINHQRKGKKLISVEAEFIN